MKSKFPPVPLSLACLLAFLFQGPESSGQSLGTNTAPAQTLSDYSIVQQGPHSRVWQNSSGQSVTELATGMNFWSGSNWTPSVAAFEVSPDQKSFVADHIQHPTTLAANLNVEGAVTATTPDNVVLRSTPVAIGLYDAASGKSVLIASLTNSIGVLTDPQHVVYNRALVGDGISASVVYSLPDAGSFSQNIVFTGFDPHFNPTNWGFAESSIKSLQVQIFSEFYNPPQPQFESRPYYIEQDPVRRASMASPDLVDYSLDFGRYVFGPGFAYTTASRGRHAGARILKDFVTASGRTFLVESIPFKRIERELRSLPPVRIASIQSLPRAKKTRVAAADLPSLNDTRHASADKIRPVNSADLAVNMPQGLSADYVVTVSSLNEPTVFAADTTYFFSGSVVESSTVTMESAVFKFSTNATSALRIDGPLIMATTNYRPAIFTAADDNTAGRPLSTVFWSNYTGFPTNGYYSSEALTFSGVSAPSLNNVKFCYLNCAVDYLMSGNSMMTATVSHAQFVGCGTGVEISGSGDGGGNQDVFFGGGINPDGGGTTYTTYVTFKGENCLMAKVANPFNISGCVLTAAAYNFTIDSASNLFSVATNVSGNFDFTNSILSNVHSNGILNFLTIGGSCNGIYDSPTNGTAAIPTSSNPFVTAGAGNYYVNSNSALNTTGSANVPAGLLAALQAKTTQPPLQLTNYMFATNETLYPVVPRDTAGTLIGYHLDPIDYMVSCTVPANCTLTLYGGVALAYYNGAGICLTNASQLVSQGTPLQRNYLVYYSAVQEQPTNLWGITNAVAQALPILPLGGSSVNLFLTTMCAPTGQMNLFNTTNGGQMVDNLFMRSCEIYGSGANWVGSETEGAPLIGLTNNIFYRVPFAISNSATVMSFNNLFYGTTNVSTNTFTNSIHYAGTGSMNMHQNNVYDGIWVSLDGAVSNNAYLHGAATNTVFTTTNDIITNNFTWQPGPLGAYYQPTNSLLLTNGSTYAANLGLYHYTVGTNELVEGTNIVSRGYHYAALDATGNPIDTNTNGLPDYVEDSNGDGVYDSGDLANWLAPYNPFTIYDQGAFYDGWIPPNLRLGHWKFDNWSLTNQLGVGPISSNELSLVTNWSGDAVGIIETNSYLEYPVTANGLNFFNPSNGTIRFWYQPNFSNGSSNAPDFYTGQVFIYAAGADNAYWNLIFKLNGPDYMVNFNADDGQGDEQWSFQTGGDNGTPFTFKSNLWYQFAFTYSPTNMAIYTNGALFATANWAPYYTNSGIQNFNVGDGVVYYPSVSDLANGFCVGGYHNGSKTDADSVAGRMDELETFNYSMSAQQVAAGFPNFGGNSTNMLDTYYLGRSDMLQMYVDGFTNVSPTNLIPCRLGYWRFDSPLLYAEQGQMPLSSANVGLSNSWSGTALAIGSASSSQVTYPDVGSNGWANINCRQGTLRFWFKPDGSPANYPSSFIYMGTSNSAQQWSLEWTGSAVEFVTASNSSPTINVSSNYTFPSEKWTQIALTYGPTNSTLYINGSPCQGSGVAYWPNVTNRQLGMVIGNSAAHIASINGQFEEMETFNYQLSAEDILANFQTVSNVDRNLNGVPDLLEDSTFGGANLPFLGAPVVITGTVEAEQFDMGGNGYGYGTTNNHPSTGYRPTGMFITNCNDIGGGYCVQMAAGDWTAYTINVLVPQTYMVEVRATAIGTNTGATFYCEFTNTNGFYTNTGLLTLTSTNWTEQSAAVYLPAGTNTMKLRCTNNVGLFNYISIYPYWSPPTIPTNDWGLSYLGPYALMTGSNYLAASNNAYQIQYAVNALTNGGTVRIPAGTWYVSQVAPNETNDVYTNAAIYVLTNNIAIAGTNGTTLVGYNRATTIFCIGDSFINVPTQVSGFILRDITLEGRPNWAVSNVASTNVIYDTNELAGGVVYDFNTNVTNMYYTGVSVAVFGPGPLSVSPYSYNILFTNCQFLYGYNPININNTYVSNVMIISNDFTIWGGSNVYFGNVGIFSSDLFNCVVIGNTFDGNANLTNSSFAQVSSDPSFGAEVLAAAGLVWIQGGGNCFVGRNTISNYSLEGIQLNQGPNAVVCNTYRTVCNTGGTVALDLWGNSSGPTGTSIDNSTCFIGNLVYGGRGGMEVTWFNSPFTINMSGNSFQLYPCYPIPMDGPGCMVNLTNCQSANVFGNTLLSGGYGFCYNGTNGSAIFMDNNFAGATYRSVGYGSGRQSLTSAQVFSNAMSGGAGGSSFHIQLPISESFGWFLKNNAYLDAISNQVPPFLDPLSSSVHIGN